ncbi:hypothetical protein TOPH_06099 [Tolypocladium ophioglossoides CBS 100239]|uniref:Uncharacterized protein n=1 Tax=Tolypocladium ophioglossoides (strain CBS 100239) TaxID=1163406 RepID=A0A0L0N531_TOLOC|nr:hypothetical protein TOPH_06099 [Tolypocladium ophioglossoides CBS 100239]
MLKYYFYHRPTWEVERQLAKDGQDDGDDAYTAPAIDLHIPERTRLAELLCQQPDNLSFDDFTGIPIPVKEESPEPEGFPLLVEKTQCPRCIGDEAMSVEERNFSYCRPAVMNDHFDREHLDTMKKTERDGFVVCERP